MVDNLASCLRENIGLSYLIPNCSSNSLETSLAAGLLSVATASSPTISASPQVDSALSKTSLDLS